MAFKYVLEDLKLESGQRSTFIPPILKLATTLEILGGGSYQWQTGVDFVAPMAHSTVSIVTQTVIQEMERVLCPKWIRFSPSENTKSYCYEKYGIPGGE